MVYHLGQLSLATSSPAAALIHQLRCSKKYETPCYVQYLVNIVGEGEVQKELMVLWFLLVLLVLEEKQYQLCF